LQLQDVSTAYDVAASAVARFPGHRGLALLFHQLEELLANLDPHTQSEWNGTEPNEQHRNPNTQPSEPVASESATTGEFAEPTRLETTELDPDTAHTAEESYQSISTLAPEDQSEVTEPSLDAAESAQQGEPINLQPSDADAIAAQHTDTAETIEPAETEAAQTEVDVAVADKQPDASWNPIAEMSEADVSSTSYASDEAEHIPTDEGPQECYNPALPTAMYGEEPALPTMRLVETVSLDRRAMRMLRSSNIRLIPGLEFAPLRIETNRNHEQSTIDYPPFRPIRGSQRQQYRMRAAVPMTPEELEQELRSRNAGSEYEPAPTKTSLELLAERLEKVRIRASETTTPAPAPPPAQPSETNEPMVVSPTMAAIYEQQGAIDAAIRAYTILIRLHPEQRTVYEEKIAMLRQRLDQ
jgi:hypothetical protein